MEKKKILVVEDDNILRDVLMEKLTKNDYESMGAENGIVAMEKILTWKPDLILLDILMPKKDGIEVLEDLSKDMELSKIPVIIISNSGRPAEIKRALELGARDILIKAVFEPKEVLEKIEKILKGL